MRNWALLFYFWSVYCCFTAGSLTTLRPQGSLRGNVHLFLLLFFPLLSYAGPTQPCEPFFSRFVSEQNPFPLRCVLPGVGRPLVLVLRMRASASKLSWRLPASLEGAWVGVVSRASSHLH